jgi:hypothetical protein
MHLEDLSCPLRCVITSGSRKPRTFLNPDWAGEIAPETSYGIARRLNNLPSGSPRELARNGFLS